MPWCCCCCYNLSDEVQATATTPTTKSKYENSSSMRIAPKRVYCIPVIYNTSICAYMPHTYATVN